MTAPQKLMARLNVPNIRFDVGAGGIPDLTVEDIAGALADVKNPLARGVFTLLWWPDGSQLERNQILTDLRNHAWEEQGLRARAWMAASDLAAIARANLDQARVKSEDMRRELAMAEARAHAARRKVWPRTNIGMYSSIVLAALSEFRSGGQCPKCGGREDVTDARGLKVRCDRCGGTGRTAHTNVARAAALNIDESTFRKTWSGVYEWIYTEVNDLEHIACEGIRSALREPA